MLSDSLKVLQLTNILKSKILSLVTSDYSAIIQLSLTISIVQSLGASVSLINEEKTLFQCL